MVSFDDVLPTLIMRCERSPAFATIERIAVVRDLRGRVRLVVELVAPGKKNALDALSDELAHSLGGYFVPPILRTDQGGDGGRLAKSLLQQARDFQPAYTNPLTFTQVEGHPTKWKRIERRLSKQAWLDDNARNEPPWPLAARAPAIVTFYSFKGGVGRTTALAACAWQLAAQNPPKRVAVVDLDLEAPGLGALFGVDLPRGVLDFIVDFVATGSTDLGRLSAPASALGSQEAEQVEVFPAGKLSEPYLDKLARLDFVASGPWEHGAGAASPVEVALRELLKAIRRSGVYDYILIDSRAGLHDLAGLSLHGLAHVDVLIGRGTEQGYQGLELTVSMLARRRDPNSLLCALVHAMAPQAGDHAEAIEAAAFRARSWDAFLEHVYGDNAPDESADDAPHAPWPIRIHTELERFTDIGQVRPILFGDDFQNVRLRIEELCAVPPSTHAEDA